MRPDVVSPCRIGLKVRTSDAPPSISVPPFLIPVVSICDFTLPVVAAAGDPAGAEPAAVVPAGFAAAEPAAVVPAGAALVPADGAVVAADGAVVAADGAVVAPPVVALPAFGVSVALLPPQAARIADPAAMAAPLRK